MSSTQWDAKPVPDTSRPGQGGPAAVLSAPPLLAQSLIPLLEHRRAESLGTLSVRGFVDPKRLARSPNAAAIRRLLRHVGATSILGILRRPQAPDDLTPAVRQQVVKAVVRATLGLTGPPILSLVRFAITTPWGQRIYLIPYLPPTTRQMAKLPAKYRNGHLLPTTATFSLYPITSAFATPSALKTTGVWGGNVGGGRFVFVVPDGVARVAIWPSTGSIRNDPHPLMPARSKPIVLTIHNNAAAFQTRHAFRPGQEIWYGPSGKIIKRIDNASSCALAGCA
jgi:hypothetical protein